ncbi:hypothetical protein ACFFHH_05135 [Cytobacillus solani]|uniref:Zinc-finger domain-containing protein n=1 Tax=Cytobacillus solani TaxID=1637975 RepID=A0A0Q3QJ32_9BACI|nr:hypothetical protein [Cytobacillus solani]KOP71273.1 hypothetical protein AMS60_24905 [Bacillus sp. FJAT-21945]KQL17785.1 hypothetical protein AN957_03590 [Cytobacillus solani]USK55594.1 hypothetical protein LIS82_03395 [Cytobacillus solani]
MMHYSEQEWMKYVKNELDKDVREDYENHLYSCDQCLESYLMAVEAEEDELPIISNGADFTDLVMAQIADVKMEIAQKPQTGQKKKSIYQSAFFHYSIAAAVTILLMTTGVFQSITQYAENVQNPNLQEEPSMTQGLVDKTFAWMDSLEMKNKEAGR